MASERSPAVMVNGPRVSSSWAKAPTAAASANWSTQAGAKTPLVRSLVHSGEVRGAPPAFVKLVCGPRARSPSRPIVTRGASAAPSQLRANCTPPCRRCCACEMYWKMLCVLARPVITAHRSSAPPAAPRCARAARRHRSSNRRKRLATFVLSACCAPASHSPCVSAPGMRWSRSDQARSSVYRVAVESPRRVSTRTRRVVPCDTSR